MSKPLTTSERLAMVPATMGLLDAWRRYEDVRRHIDDALGAAQTLGARAAMPRVLRLALQLSGVDDARRRWEQEYVTLRGVSEQWARRCSARVLKESPDG